jgi:hypothetical protein
MVITLLALWFIFLKQRGIFSPITFFIKIYVCTSKNTVTYMYIIISETMSTILVRKLQKLTRCVGDGFSIICFKPETKVVIKFTLDMGVVPVPSV